jgi:peptide/nickel transport system permease protein
LALATVVAVPLGIISAVMQDSPADYVARLVAIAGVAMPNFWLAILIIIVLVNAFGWLPPLGYEDLWENPGKNLLQLIFPAIALGFYNMALIARVTRSAMLEVFREDYIRTARSKGLTERVIIVRHALKNASLPVLTISGWQIGRLLAGTVVIEKIFLVPGVGRLLIDSIFARDFTMIQAIVMMVATMVLLLNLVVDLMYGWLDPRIRFA